MAFLKSFAEALTPLLTVSQFYENGVLTPEEFVKAGDHLVKTCQTWQWAKGLPSNARSYLPADKQYLITRNVPSTRRAKGYIAGNREETVKIGESETKDDEWTLAFADGVDLGAGKTAVSGESKSQAASATPEAKTAAPDAAAGDDDADDDDIPELKDSDDEDVPAPKPGNQRTTSGTSLLTPGPTSFGVGAGSNTAGENPESNTAALTLEDDDDDATLTVAGHKVRTNAIGAAVTDAATSSASGPMMVVGEPQEKFVKTRTYDISIVYDRYYRTPRVYLYGYNEHGQPLTYDEIIQDISADHAGKTVTQEAHPLTGVTNLSIHPCRHAQTMKRLLDSMYEHELEVATAAYNAAMDAAQKAKAERDADLAKWSGTGMKIQEAPIQMPNLPKPSETATQALRTKMPVEKYMFLFLKFISSVIPTIEYDYTLTLDL